jgi:hypothetical protein
MDFSQIDIRKAFPAANKFQDRALEFHKKVSRISMRFVATSANTFDADMNTMLAEVGKHFNVQRAYLFIFGNNNTTATNSHEWCSEGVEPQIQNLQEVPTSLFP